LNDKIVRPTALYRYFDRQGELLYIGISKTPIIRLSTHQCQKNWEFDIASITIAYFETRPRAVNAERLAIRAENPRYNIQGKGQPYIAGRNRKPRTEEEKREAERQKKATYRAKKKAKAAAAALTA
jgi:excinuclease UvrABC nuclease subunit